LLFVVSDVVFVSDAARHCPKAAGLKAAGLKAAGSSLDLPPPATQLAAPARIATVTRGPINIQHWLCRDRTAPLLRLHKAQAVFP
jgi:hypothetical protein